MQSEKSMEELGLTEIFGDRQNIVVVEWAERLGNLLPTQRIDIRFANGNAQSERRIVITYVTN